MAANGNLIFQDTNKATFVGANSNVVIDTVHASFGVGVDVNGPTSNLHVVGNAYVTSNLEVGTDTLVVDSVNDRVGIGTTSPLQPLHVKGNGENPVIYLTDAINNRYASGMGTHNVGGVGQRLDFYNGDSGVNGTSLTSSQIRMSIHHDGAVGIGTTSPIDLLDVHYPTPSYGSLTGTEEGSLTVSAGAEHSNAAVYFRTPFDAAAPAKRAIFSDGGGYSGGSSGGLHFCLESTNDNTTKVDLTDSKMVIKQNGDVGIGYTTPTERFHVHENLPTTGHHIMTRIGGDTSSYNTLVFGSKEGRPHIGGHRGDFGAWADLSLQNDSLIISQSGSIVNVNGTLRIQGYNTKRVLIGYQKFENNTGTSWGASQTGYQNAWSVNYVRKKAGSQIYVTCDLCMAQAMGATATTSYRSIDGRLKVYDQVTDRYSNSTRDWQRIDNSFYEYQRQSRIYYGPHTLPGAQTGWTVTVVAQVEAGSGTGTANSWGINIWGGRSVIEVYETMEA